MLKLTDQTKAYLRTLQKGSEGRERYYRARGASAMPMREMDEHRFKRLAANVARVLDAGEPTKFAFEGACRHGVRVSLIFEGWDWREADATAAIVVSTALLMLGAKRPSWNEGQIDFATAHRHDRYYCKRCGSPIAEERKRNGTPAKYCSALCRAAATQDKARKSGERVEMAAYLAQLSLKREQAVRERTRACKTCKTPFLAERVDSLYCSRRCTGVGRRAHEEIPCQTCGREFRPRKKGDAISTYCSRTCAGQALKKEVAPQECQKCGIAFIPISKRPQRFCSSACFGADSRKVRPELTCRCCKTVFRPRYPSDKRLYCSPACGRTARHASNSNFRCEEAS